LLSGKQGNGARKAIRVELWLFPALPTLGDMELLQIKKSGFFFFFLEVPGS
jgi:hypothetical protein